MEFDLYDAGFPEGGWEALRDLCPPVRFPEKETIYTQGDLADCFYYLIEGRVRIYLSSPRGLEKTLTIRESGSVLGTAAFFDRMPRMSSARAITGCMLAPVGQEALLRAFSAHPQLAAQMLAFLARTVRMLSAQVDDITFLPADRRLARVLVRRARPAGGRLCVSCTHEELSLLAGTSRVTVSRVLRGFCARGWTQTKYRGVVVLSPGELSAFACEPDIPGGLTRADSGVAL